jgi:hypothetical protein
MLGVVYMSDAQQVDPNAFPATVAVTTIFAISNSLNGRLLALPANIRLVWKWLTVLKTLTNYTPVTCTINVCDHNLQS